MTHRILGVDTGINGACALHVPGEIIAGPEQLFDIPTIGSGKQREIDYARLRDMIWLVRPTHAFVEKINAFVPKDDETGEPIKWGATSMLKFGGAFYAIKAVICCLNIPCRELNAAEWKAAFSLRGGKENKDASRHLVIQRHPEVAALIPLVKHGHRAEAKLIAVYGARKLRREGENLDIPE